MNVINKIEREQMKTDAPDFGPGDTVNVHSRVIEGGKERIQIYKGLVIGRHGSGINEAFTVRKISNGEGVERSFQIHSPKTAKIEVLKRGKVRRAKLNYLRNRLGKAATNLKTRETKASETKVGESKVSETKASETKASESKVSESEGSE